MQDKTSKKPKGKAKELESLGATTKVQAKAFTYSSEETRWIDPPGPIRLLGLTVSGLDERFLCRIASLNHHRMKRKIS